MYDTVNFWLDRVEVENITTPALYLANSRETLNKETGELWTVGDMDNMRVTVSAAGVSIKGSLAKFYLPDNSYTLNRNQVKDAIIKLSDCLHIDLMKAKATRIDVSTNFIMQNEASRYYSVLGLCNHFNRVQATSNTLYYYSRGKEQKKTLIFYDKAREINNRDGILPDVYLGANLLRYESRWNTRLPQQLKVAEIKGKTLFDPSFYSNIVQCWADNYFKIEKKRTINTDAMDKIKTVSEAMNFICAIALQKLPTDEIQDILVDMKQKQVFKDRISYTRLKKKLKDIQGKTDLTDTDDLVRELDAEMRQVLAYKR
ncbi:hypothetical protein LJC68_09730 [Bacteroidales bacterium OttesenSCG-928-B11]|nr:hypothetical protein [Bacteroidales bacterium OttesenSCG-928-E04]MDL2313140.1 hypothetical protein [Bacteroidales bacterium OttesenSCG-928-B11]MDL2326813.1 hypothetical protein [Bacteroidales bacterium OttesenSCG-928-A14]